MKTEVLSQEKNVLVVKAEFDAVEVNSAVANTVKKLSGKANIKGFRKGHVPRRAIELYFGKQGIYQETMEDILQSAIEQAVEEYDLNLINHPDIKPAELEEDKPISIEITFEVTPEVTMPELESIEAEKIIYKVTEQMEQENIDRMLESASEIVPLYEERALDAGDYVSVKFTSGIVNEDGTTTPVEAEQKTEIFLGQENIRPQIVEALVGKKPGDSATIEFPVEEEASDKDLAGKTMRYEIEVQGIMQKQTPELNDAAVEQITHSRYKTVEELRKAIREQLELSAEMQAMESLKTSAVGKLVEMSEVDLPESLVTRQAEAMRQDQAGRIKNESGLAMEEFFEKSGMDKESYDAELEASAKLVVKRSLVLEAIADKEDIQTSPGEFDSELLRMSSTARMEPDKLRKLVLSSNERIYEITSRIRNRKTVDFLITKVKVTEVEDQSGQAEAQEDKPKTPDHQKVTDGSEKDAPKVKKEPKAKKEPKETE